MEHLTGEEIKRFASLERLTPEALRDAAKVNAHILRCDLCLERVREALLIYENVRRGNRKDTAEKERKPEMRMRMRMKR